MLSWRLEKRHTEALMIPGKNHHLRISLAIFIITLGIGTLIVPMNAQEPTTDATSLSPHAKLVLKLKSIIIDKVDFNKTDIATVIDFLSKKSKELDPAKQGINFVLRLPDAPESTASHVKVHREVSMTLDNIPLIDLIMEISEQTNLKFTIEDYAVSFHPVD